LASSSLDAVRAAKAKARALLPPEAEIVGIGLTIADGRDAIKVNLARPCPLPLPDTIDGVPVVYAVVGSIAPRERP